MTHPSTPPPSRPNASDFLPVLLENSRIVVGESDSDGIERDDLFAPRPRKRGFKRPRQPWSLVKEWPLSDYGREIVYAEIKAICEQSLEDAGGKLTPTTIHCPLAGFVSRR